ncbi:acetyltransferase [Hymenobacter elongatus]|uniref:Acetyltransferase n=1 Tax=Hymenobacter elongatus TaxID=877208 RepID=A0A4Z0PHJ8_9BACT|nr:acetyltransferase [Hymenobacter elongatus]TGE14692.1 acetyltransferase [Hymenobacter elongatus]
MEVIIYGIGNQAEMTHYLFTHDSPHEVVAFCVDSAYLTSTTATFFGLPVVAFEELTTYYPAARYQLHIAIGQIRARRRVFEAAKAQGYSFASYISSKAQTWPDLVVGEHVFIDPVTIIHPFVTFGDNIISIGCRIGHHSHIGSHILISSTTLGGNVTIGDGTFIGMGSIINEDVVIGRNNIIGSGCLIGKRTEDNAVYSGQYTQKRLVTADRVALFRK